MLQYTYTLFKVVACTSWLFAAMPHRGVMEAMEYSMNGGAQGTFDLKCSIKSI